MTGIRPCPPLPPHLLRDAKVLPQRADILPFLPKGGTVVEVGVALGDYTALMLDICRPSRFVAIDIFTLHEFPMIWDRTRAEVFGTGTHEAHYRARFAADIRSGLLQVVRSDSRAALSALDDGSIDVLYLDAEHSYESVRGELEAAACKMKPEGWIVLNDYIMNDIGTSFAPYGVIQAAHEFMVAEDWEMAFLALHPLMYCDVALRRKGSS